MMPLSQNEERFNKDAVFLLGYTLATLPKNETLFIKTSTSVMAAKRSLADKRLSFVFLLFFFVFGAQEKKT